MLKFLLFLSFQKILLRLQTCNKSWSMLYIPNQQNSHFCPNDSFILFSCRYPDLFIPQDVAIREAMNEAGAGTTGGRRRRRNVQFLTRICEVEFPATTNLVTISSTDPNHANYAAQLVGVKHFAQNRSHKSRSMAKHICCVQVLTVWHAVLNWIKPNKYFSNTVCQILWQFQDGHNWH